jgi:hypothetical protein
VKLPDFVAALEKDKEVKTLAKEVESFAAQFPIPGF